MLALILPRALRHPGIRAEIGAAASERLGNRMRKFRRRSVLLDRSKRGLVAVVTLVFVGSLQVTPAFAGTASPGDTVIDNFTAGSGSWSACGNSTFVYYQNPSIIGGARELAMRDGGSCHFGRWPAKMAIDAAAGTGAWYGDRTYAPEQHFSYGTEIGTFDQPWSISPNRGVGAPLNLHLSLSDNIIIQMVHLGNTFVQVRLRDGNGSTYIQNVTLVLGTNLVPLSGFSDITPAAAASIDGISFTGSVNTTPGNVVSLFAVRSGDTTPPAAAPTQTPAANINGWNNTDVTVNWNWADSGSGIDSANCTQSSTSTGEGAITLTSTCKDLAGNTASASYVAKVDKTAPTVVFAGNAGTYTVAQSVAITCTAGDALSGVDSILSNCPSLSASALSIGLGTTTLTANVFDRAGNATTASTSFTVTVDEDSLCALVKVYSTNNGIAHALCAKLDAAAAAEARGQLTAQANILNAFVNQVAAQSGKAFTVEQSAVLTQLAKTL